MAVRLRLARMGSKKRPFYRIVAADSESPRDGKFLEIVGTYNPNCDPAKIDVKEEKVKKWLNNGALPTKTVADILKKSGMTSVNKVA